MAKQTWMKIDGEWVKAKSAWIKEDGEWKKDVMPKGVVSGDWREFMQYYIPSFISSYGDIKKYEIDGETVSEAWTINLPAGENTMWFDRDPLNDQFYIQVYQKNGEYYRQYIYLFDYTTGVQKLKITLDLYSTTNQAFAGFASSPYAGGIIYTHDRMKDYLHCYDSSGTRILYQSLGNMRRIYTDESGNMYTHRAQTGYSDYLTKITPSGTVTYGANRPFENIAVAKTQDYMIVADRTINANDTRRYSTSDLSNLGQFVSTTVTQGAPSLFDDQNNLYANFNATGLTKYDTNGDVIWTNTTVSYFMLFKNEKILDIKARPLAWVDPDTGIKTNINNEQFTRSVSLTDRGAVGAYPNI